MCHYEKVCRAHVRYELRPFLHNSHLRRCIDSAAPAKNGLLDVDCVAEIRDLQVADNGITVV